MSITHELLQPESRSDHACVLETIIFIPCCDKKTANGHILANAPGISPADLPSAWHQLVNGRALMQPCIVSKSQLTSAVNLYQGHFYATVGDEWNNLLQSIQTGRLRIFVISAGYGIVDIREPIQLYDAKMSGCAARVWKQNDLVKVIGDLLVSLKPQRVFGYFAGQSAWAGGSGKYRYFFTEGVRDALSNNLGLCCAGCFYNLQGRSASFILSSLAQVLVCHSQAAFDCAFGPKVANKPLVFQGTNSTVTISYDKIV